MDAIRLLEMYGNKREEIKDYLRSLLTYGNEVYYIAGFKLSWHEVKNIWQSI